MAKKVAIPLELKYKFASGGYVSLLKGVMYAIREKYGAAAVLEIFERVWKMEDRVKNMTTTLKNVFKIEGNDMEAIAKWYDIWWELQGLEATRPELSKTRTIVKVTQCPWKTWPKDISDWDLFLQKIIIKTINQKATIEMPKSMCAGDPYCEFITKIEL
jgi:hypothetical protein